MEYFCNICNKKYVSYKSLWNHNSKYHKTPNNTETTVTTTETPPKNTQKIQIKCTNCNINFSRKDSLNRHIKKNKCKIPDTKSEIEEMKKEIAEYKTVMEIEMEKLRDIIKKSLKIHPKTLQKINNTLNNNTNNGVINNITYVQLGNEDLVNVLSKSEKRGILNRKAMGINDLVALVHCSGKYKEFMNVYITNLQNTVAYRYDKKINNFIVVNKNELLDEIIDARIYDITKFLEEAEKVLEPNTAADIKRIIKKMEQDNSFKGLKKEEIKFILYNNKEKIATQKEQLELDKENELIV